MKKEDITFTPLQISLLREFYHCNFCVSKFAREKGLATTTFHRLIRNFERSNPEMTTFMKKKQSPAPSDYEKEMLSLRLENERLRTELKHEKLRSHAYDKMIDVAEEMFNIPIRKKADTKQ